MNAVTPVIYGLEDEEIKVAEHQPKYNTLPVLVIDDYIVSRWEVTDADLENIKESRSIYLWMMRSNQPVTPVMVLTENPNSIEQELIDARKT